MATIVFSGGAASTEVVAGFLRASGMHSVDIVPATPYPAGPLRHAYVRVLDEAEVDGTRRLLSGVPRPGPALQAPEFPLRMRLMAIYLLCIRALFLAA